jgi:hypothetical protein
LEACSPLPSHPSLGTPIDWISSASVLTAQRIIIPGMVSVRILRFPFASFECLVSCRTLTFCLFECFTSFATFRFPNRAMLTRDLVLDWSGWGDLGGVFNSPLAVESWGPNSLDVVGLGTDNAIYHKHVSSTPILFSPPFMPIQPRRCWLLRISD